jgi:hypothetical protein
MKRFTLFAVLVALLAMAPATAPLAAEDAESAAPAAALKTLLEQLQLEVFVVRDPEEPGRYVGVLYVPGSQLLVVSTPYPVPAALDKRIAEGKYMDAYQDIQTVRDRQGLFFVMDSLADGLRREPKLDQPFDSTSTDNSAPIAFDGKWKAQQLTEEQYEEAFATGDARYARMLKVLTTALARRTTDS